MTYATKLNEVRYDIFEEYICWHGSLAIAIRYTDWDNMPKLVEYKGNKYARTGHNSDNMVAYYSIHAYNIQATEIKQ